MMRPRWLYLARIGTGEFKIGVSVNVDERMNSLMREGHGWVRLNKTWRLDDDCFPVETLVKGLLDNAGLRSPEHPANREIFKADHKQMMAAVQCARYLVAGKRPALICEQIRKLTRPVGVIPSDWYVSPKLRQIARAKRRAGMRARLREAQRESRLRASSRTRGAR